MEYTESELALADDLGVSHSPYLYELIKEVNGRAIIISKEIKHGILFWLQCDYWNITDGMLLIAGINPNENRIFDWGDPTSGGINYPDGDFTHFNFFHEGHAAPEVYPPKFPRESDDKQLNSVRFEVYEMQRLDYERRTPDLRRSLGILKADWDRSAHPNDSGKYPPEYFIQWADKKKHHIPWLEWAKRHQLISTSNENKQISRPERTEKTAKKMIVGLIKALAEKGGNQYGSANKPNVSQVYEEVIKHLPENTRGMSPANFDNYYKEGLKLLDENSN
jgi:hypothetical protein